jgi:hypothetical protein
MVNNSIPLLTEIPRLSSVYCSGADRSSSTPVPPGKRAYVSHPRDRPPFGCLPAINAPDSMLCSRYNGSSRHSAIVSGLVSVLPHIDLPPADRALVYGFPMTIRPYPFHWSIVVIAGRYLEFVHQVITQLPSPAGYMNFVVCNVGLDATGSVRALTGRLLEQGKP